MGLLLLILAALATEKTSRAPCLSVQGNYTDPFSDAVTVSQNGCHVVATTVPVQSWSPATGYASTDSVVLDFPGIGNLTAHLTNESLQWSNGVQWRKPGPPWHPKTPVIQLPAAGPVRCEEVGQLTVQCLGIQFGKAKRWRRSTMTEPWTETRDALRYGPVCAQGLWGLCTSSGSALPKACAEDCLYLNVFAPRPGLHPPGTKHPVVVWIHGGGYEGGSSQGLNGTAHVEASGADIVWVTIQYRLAAFGFLGSDALRNLDAEGSTGNYGLQDQRLALEWVQKNIAGWQGDPDRVTIDGCSAGAGSTANHVANANSWPYFTQAAGESGMFAMWNANTLAVAEKVMSELANFTGCGERGPANAVACLHTKSATEIIRASSLLPGLLFDMPRIDGIVWAPVIDGVDTIGHPFALAKAGHHFKGPMLLGTARDEGASFNWWSAGDCPVGTPPCPVLTPPNLSKAEFSDWAPRAMPGVALDLIIELYSGHPPTKNGRGLVHSEWWWAAAKLTGDVGFHCGSRLGARWLSGTQKVFLYSWSPAVAFRSTGQDVIGHCSENPTIYMSEQAGADFVGPNLTSAVGSYWYSFAKHGDPNPSRASGALEWPAYRNSSDINIVFDSPIRTETGLRKRQCDMCAKTPLCEASVPPLATPCANALLAVCPPPAGESGGTASGMTQCDECIGRYQAAMRTDGCSAGEVQEWCRRQLKSDDNMLGDTFVAKITAAAPSIVTKMTQAGMELKFPAMLGWVPTTDGSEPWLTVGYSNQSDATHDNGFTGTTFASQNGTGPWQLVHPTKAPWMLTGMIEKASSVLAFSYTLRYRSGPAEPSAAFLQGWELTADAEGVTQQAARNLSIHFPPSHLPGRQAANSSANNGVLSNSTTGLVATGCTLPLKSGGLLATAYGTYLEDSDQAQAQRNYSLLALRSTDMGAQWHWLSTVVRHGEPAVYDVCKEPSESDTIYLKNGDLFTVFRGGGWRGPVGAEAYFPLCSSVSSSEGRSWSRPKIMCGPKTNTMFTAGPAGVEPKLLKLPNGLLVLSTGRPGIFAYVAEDPPPEVSGVGRWQRFNIAAAHNAMISDRTLTFSSIVTNDTIPGHKTNGTTSYTGMVAVPGANEVLVSYDRLGNGWGPLEEGQASAVMLMKLSIERSAKAELRDRSAESSVGIRLELDDEHRAADSVATVQRS